MQQGGSPSPFDRNLGTKLAVKCVNWFAEQFERHTQSDDGMNFTDKESACLIGLLKRQYKFTPLSELIAETNFE